MLIIKTLDVEINKNGKSYLISDNSITGASLEVLSFMSSGIKKRCGSSTSDGRPGRINYYSEDEYRTITMTVEATAEDMQDIAHLRDAVNELFDGEMFIREMRIKDIKIEYERPGQRTGELQLEAPEYVNGKQIKVAMVNSPEIDDTTLVSTFTVEFETTELPYFESIYTTRELHDSGYAHSAEKYGLVDNIDDEKVKYRFEPEILREELTKSEWELGGIHSGTGENTISDTTIRTKSYFKTIPGQEYVFEELLDSSKIDYWWIMEYDNAGNYIGFFSTIGSSQTNKRTFTARGYRVRMRPSLRSGQTISADDVGVNIRPTISGVSMINNFTVYNAGNITVEPESMFLEIYFNAATSNGDLTLRNNTTGDEFKFFRTINRRNLSLKGMVFQEGSIHRFRDTNKQFIRLVPGDNHFTMTGNSGGSIVFNFKYYYK